MAARANELLNYYGLPIAEDFDGEHVANPMGAGMPPVCSCGWTRLERAPGRWVELADHLREVDARSADA